MSAADLLVELMFSWMEQREECAKKLMTLAQELESLREKCNLSKAVGSTVAVVGSVCLIGAGVATLFTGGAAAPLLGLAGSVCSGTGVGISLITKLTEHLNESNTMKDAMTAERRVHEITKRIQRLSEQLKEECEKANPNADPDDQDQHLMTEIVGAMAKQSGLNPRSIKYAFQWHFSHLGRGAKNLPRTLIQPALEVGLGGLLKFFGLKASGKGSKILLDVGGVIGLAFELPEAINHWKDLIEKNNVTAASQSLRDTADDLQKINRALRAQLNEIKIKLEDLDQLKSCTENSNRSSEQKKSFIRIAEKCIRDPDLLKWLKETCNSEIFFKLFYLLKQELDKKRKKTDREDIDIIFVAHGGIQEPLIPASTLLPLFTIEDVILYSPWNCTIDSNVAYGIATARLQTQDRVFCCRQKCGCSDDDRHKPRSLPPKWNSMGGAGCSKIPNIFVSPLNHPEDPVWKKMLSYTNEHGEPGRNRVVIPYIIPGYDGDGSMRIPFCVVTLALSLVLFFSPFTARVHLAACLSGSSKKTLTKDLEQQYSWTKDFTRMTARIEALSQCRWLYRALRASVDDFKVIIKAASSIGRVLAPRRSLMPV